MISQAVCALTTLAFLLDAVRWAATAKADASAADRPTVAAWMARDGMAAVRLVHELIGWDRYDPPLRGFTRLDPVTPE